MSLSESSEDSSFPRLGFFSVMMLSSKSLPSSKQVYKYISAIQCLLFCMTTEIVKLKLSTLVKNFNIFFSSPKINILFHASAFGAGVTTVKTLESGSRGCGFRSCLGSNPPPSSMGPMSTSLDETKDSAVTSAKGEYKLKIQWPRKSTALVKFSRNSENTCIEGSALRSCSPSPVSLLSSFQSDHPVVLCSLVECTMI